MKLKLFLIIALIACAACSRNIQKQYNKPGIIPSSYKITVASFTQPLIPAELISGSMPEASERVGEDTLQTLDNDFKQVLLTQTKREYAFLPSEIAPTVTYPVSGQTRALTFWLDYGKTHNIDYLLIPQILIWYDRKGSEAGVTQAAEIKLAFTLLDVKKSIIVASSVFEEKQVGLIDNMLTVGDFIKRKGKWVSAMTLAKEGMMQAVREMDL